MTRRSQLAASLAAAILVGCGVNHSEGPPPPDSARAAAFLDTSTGRRFQNVELSTIDTSLLLAGILLSQSYYDGPDPVETEIRALADSIYFRVDWNWAQARPPAVTMGWHPEGGFIPTDWIGYNQAMILYVLALASPPHAVDATAWSKSVSGYQSGRLRGQSYV